MSSCRSDCPPLPPQCMQRSLPGETGLSPPPPLPTLVHSARQSGLTGRLVVTNWGQRWPTGTPLRRERSVGAGATTCPGIPRGIPARVTAVWALGHFLFLLPDRGWLSDRSECSACYGLLQLESCSVAYGWGDACPAPGGPRPLSAPDNPRRLLQHGPVPKQRGRWLAWVWHWGSGLQWQQ